MAREQAGPDSDLDLLIDLPPNYLIRRRNFKPTVLATAEQAAIPL